MMTIVADEPVRATIRLWRQANAVFVEAQPSRFEVLVLDVTPSDVLEG